MTFTASPITYFVTCPPNILLIVLPDAHFVDIIASLSTVTDVRLLQLSKARLPMVVTLSGIMMVARLVQRARGYCVGDVDSS